MFRGRVESEIEIEGNAVEAAASGTHILVMNEAGHVFALGLNDHGFLLEPYDEVFVRRSPAFGQQMNVRIQGEVLFEGTYTMKTQDDRLSDLVLQAGGLSSHAYTTGARLQRRMTPEEKLRRDQLLKINKAASAKNSSNVA